MLLLEEFQFFSWDFPFVAMSMSSCVRSRQFVAWNNHTIVFSYFCFQGFVFLFVFMFCLQLLATVINFLCALFNEVVEYLYWDIWDIFPVFLETYDISVISCALALTFLSSDSFLWVISLSILRIILNKLQWKLPRCLFLWWDFCCRAWFWEFFFIHLRNSFYLILMCSMLFNSSNHK